MSQQDPDDGHVYTGDRVKAAPNSPLVEKVAMVLAAYAWEYGIADTVQEDVGLYVAENAKRYDGQARAALAACEAEAMLATLKRLTEWAALRSDYARAGQAGEEPEGHPLHDARVLLARLEGKP